MKTLRVMYEGRVQGVGFRWTTRHLAQGFDITGQVKNLPDGRVELMAKGDKEEVDSFLQAIRESELAGHITQERSEDFVAPVSFRGFQIIT